MEYYDDFLTHYGTPGMKWGIRNQATLAKYGLLSKGVGASGGRKDDEDGEEKKSFDELSDDPNSKDYVMVGGNKVYKAEDGTAYVIDKNGKYHYGDTPGEALRQIDGKWDSYEYGSKKKRFSQLSEDPNSNDYAEISGYKVQKAEDGTAYIRGIQGKMFTGDTAGQAIKAAKQYEKREQLRRKASDIRRSLNDRRK